MPIYKYCLAQTVMQHELPWMLQKIDMMVGETNLQYW